MILVVGATGQLGSAVVRQLAHVGQGVRAFVRPTSAADSLRIPNVEVALGDLRDASSVEAACTGARAIIATANTVVPRTRYSFVSDEQDGYRNLISAAERHKIGQFVLMSVPVTPRDAAVPTLRFKRIIEQHLMKSATPYTIFRGSLFMDDWFALMGSSIPLRGAEAATLRRPFWFSRAFMRGAGRMIDQHGIALVPGSGKTRHAFIAVNDVASFLVNAIDRNDAHNEIFEIGGPQVLSWDDVVALFAKVLRRSVRAVHVPIPVFRLQQLLLRPFSPAAANLMGMNWIVGAVDTTFKTESVAARFAVKQTSGEEFLRAKYGLRD